MSWRSLLGVQSLENRDTPATFGTPWPDGQHLTLSFSPNSTPIGAHTSNWGNLGASAQMQILTAVQAWAAHSDLNIGLVSDDGAAFGTGGPVQGDPRFGDIRVGGLDLAPDVLAITAPYNLFDNYSGDVVVNRSAYGPGGPDLFTVMLQESGHALGIGNSSDPASVMYEYYRGPRTGLSPGDIQSILSLYGPRQPDPYEGPGGNNTLANATRYPGSLTADLGSASDVDVYAFTGGLLARNATITVHTEGISLLTPRVEVLDSRGRTIVSAVTTDPTNNDLTVTLNSVAFGSTYYVRVSSGRSDAFGVGAYELDLKQQTLLGGILDTVGGLLNDTGLNDTLRSATNLLSNSNTVSAADEYGVDGNFGSSSDVDDYRIVIPPSPDGQPVNMIATVWGKNGAVLEPWITAYDALGHALSAQVLAADGNTTTLQVLGLVPGNVYFLSLSSDTHQKGDYHLSIDLRQSVVAFDHGGTGTLSAGTPVSSADFVLPQTDQIHFVLSATGSVQLLVIDDNGSIAAQVAVPPGRGRSIDVILPAGHYRVLIRSNVLSSSVAYQLGITIVTDPTGATPTDPTSNPEQPPSNSPPPPPPDNGGNSTSTLQPSNPDSDDAWWY